VCLSSIHLFRNNVTAASTWLRGMTSSAQALGITVQWYVLSALVCYWVVLPRTLLFYNYWQRKHGPIFTNLPWLRCMSYPRYLLEALKLPAVTNARASTDFMWSYNNGFHMPYTAWLVYALGLKPSKVSCIARTAAVHQEAGARGFAFLTAAVRRTTSGLWDPLKVVVERPMPTR
jgi:hypothetical protein